MNELLVNNAKKLRLSDVVTVWLGLFVLVTLPTGVVVYGGGTPKLSEIILVSLVFGAVAATLGVVLYLFIRWLRSWRNVRRLLVGLGVFATLIAIFYAEENWRCKRDWENYKQAKIAAGNWHEWDELVPPPVPDAENVLAAPHMADAFTKGRKDELAETCAKKFTAALSSVTRTQRVDYPVAELVFVLPGEVTPPDGGEPLAFTDVATAGRVRELIEQAIGPRFDAPRSLMLFARSPETVSPARILLRVDHVPSTNELEKLLPSKGWPMRNDKVVMVYHSLMPQGHGAVVNLRLSGWCLAEDYLAASAASESFYEAVDAALTRPKVRRNCDYSIPWNIDIPNFVQLRNLAQDLAARAQSHVLLGQSAAAVRDLARMKRLERFTVEQGPMTLVAAMINVAIHGLYTAMIADGLRLHAWSDAQLAELQQQIAGTDLLSPVQQAFQMERLATDRSCDIWRADPAEFVRSMTGSATESGRRGLSAAAKREVLVLRAIPAGWYYQNQRIYNETMDTVTAHGIEGKQVFPQRAGNGGETVDRLLLKESLSYGKYAKVFLTALAIPNFSRAIQTAARNQTLLNEALVACALERHRLAHGEYPETLPALVPQYLAAIPADVIGGQPLKYQRRADGSFLLYSVGWNEQDDGGKAAPVTKTGRTDLNRVDWVWDAEAH